MKNYGFNVSNMIFAHVSDLYTPVSDTHNFFEFLMNPVVNNK